MPSFSRPDAADIPLPLADRETTSDKRLRQYRAALARRGRRPKQLRQELPGLDVAVLAARYGGDPANTTVQRVGSFKVPMGISTARWQRYRNLACEKFLAHLDATGFVVARIAVQQGVYPYVDVLTGRHDPAYREMLLVATGGVPKVESVAIELEPEDVAPLVLTR